MGGPTLISKKMSELATVDSRIGSSTFAINLVAHPPEEIVTIASEIQEIIIGLMPPDTLLRCPISTLHMSVFQFVHARKSSPTHDSDEWKSVSEEVLLQLDSATKFINTCTLKTPTIEVSESAIFFLFEALSGIDTLRDRLESIASETRLSWNKPGIQHMSIFRYASPVQLDKIKAQINAIEIPCMNWELSVLQLKQENVYPSLETTVIKKYILG